MNDGNEVLTIIRIGMETQYYLLKGAVKSILQGNGQWRIAW